MKNAKKWLALVSAVCMAVPSMTAFATGATGDSATGTGSVEYDSKKVTPYYDVILSTITDDTYDFILDPFEELANYDTTTYPTSKTAYFTKTTTAQTLVNTDDTNTDGKVYAETQTEVGSADVNDALKAKFVDGSGKIAEDATKPTYYVWVPDAGNKPQGRYEQLTATNVLNYCTAKASGGTVIDKEADGTLPATAVVDALELNAAQIYGDYVFTGKLYELSKVALGTDPLDVYDVKDYVDINSTTKAVTLKTGVDLYSADKATSTVFSKLTDATNLKVVDAVTSQTDESDSFKVINKSSADTKVTATVEVKNAHGLTFFDGTPTTADDLAKAGVVLTIEGDYDQKKADGTKDSAKGTVTGGKIVADANDATVIKGSVIVNLPGLDNVGDYNTYLGPEDPATGGHEYLRYTHPKMEYYEADLNLKIAANGDATSKDSWETYVKALKDAYESNNQTAQQTEIEVVYKLENVVGAPEEVEVSTSWATNNSGLWFQLDGNVIDKSKITAVQVKKADGTYVAASTTLVTLDNEGGVGGRGDYANVTWTGLNDAGADTDNVEFKITYNNKIYVVTVQ